MPWDCVVCGLKSKSISNDIFTYHYARNSGMFCLQASMMNRSLKPNDEQQQCEEDWYDDSRIMAEEEDEEEDESKSILSEDLEEIRPRDDYEEVIVDEEEEEEEEEEERPRVAALLGEAPVREAALVVGEAVLVPYVELNFLRAASTSLYVEAALRKFSLTYGTKALYALDLNEFIVHVKDHSSLNFNMEGISPTEIEIMLFAEKNGLSRVGGKYI